MAATAEVRSLARKAFKPLAFASGGPSMHNRFMLAPLTNHQSEEDGTMSDDEYRWLTMRAVGGHGATMSCASHVQEIGKGFPGQLGIWSDAHLEGLTRMAAEINRHKSVSIVQLHHAGMKSPKELIGGRAPVGPSDDAETGTRGLTLEEVRQLRDDFIAGAVRAQKAGFDGVQLHGAHGYIICSFLSPVHNRREDEYGPGPAGTPAAESLERRMRLLREIIAGVRAATRPDFIVGVRVSAERFGMQLHDVTEITRRLLAQEPIDFIDVSLWDVHKKPEEAAPGDSRLLIDYFTNLPRGPRDVQLGVAGKIYNVADIAHCFKHGANFISPGRASIFQHDFPKRIAADVLDGGEAYQQPQAPFTADHYRREGLGEKFITYLANRWKLVASPQPKL